MNKDEIFRFIAEWQNRILRIQGIDREYLHALQETIGSNPIKIITGFRRSGQSFLVQLAARLQFPPSFSRDREQSCRTIHRAFHSSL
jgi:predicted AAA+ superfamily ATPase